MTNTATLNTSNKNSERERESNLVIYAQREREKLGVLRPERERETQDFRLEM